MLGENARGERLVRIPGENATVCENARGNGHRQGICDHSVTGVNSKLYTVTKSEPNQAALWKITL